MEQITLNLLHKLVYNPNGFYMHSGVSSLTTEIFDSCSTDKFFVAYILGLQRTGKTHWSIYMAEQFKRDNLQVYLIEGNNIASILCKLPDISEKTIFILDDADIYLEQLVPGISGPFVAFVEHCRLQRAKILFLSKLELTNFTFDEHVSSRLKVGLGYSIKNPATEDFNNLFSRISEQRGFKFHQRQLDFVSKRLGTSIYEIENYLLRLHKLVAEKGKLSAFELLQEALVT